MEIHKIKKTSFVIGEHQQVTFVIEFLNIFLTILNYGKFNSDIEHYVRYSEGYG